MVEGDGGHAHGRRGPGRQLAEGGAQADPTGLRAPPAERGERIRAVGLGRPDRVEAQPLGLGHQLRCVGRRAGPPVAELQSELHVLHGSSLERKAFDLSVGCRGRPDGTGAVQLSPWPAMMCSANCSHMATRAAWIGLGGVVLGGLDRHPRRAQHVGHAGVLEPPVEVEVGEGLDGQVDGERLVVPPGLLERVLDPPDLGEGLVGERGPGVDPPVAQGGGPTQGGVGVPAAEDRDRAAWATGSSGTAARRSGCRGTRPSRPATGPAGRGSCRSAACPGCGSPDRSGRTPPRTSPRPRPA